MPREELLEHLDAALDHLAPVDVHRRQRRRDELRDQNVVNAHNRNILRHAQSARAQVAHHVDRVNVHRAEDRRRSLRTVQRLVHARAQRRRVLHVDLEAVRIQRDARFGRGALKARQRQGVEVVQRAVAEVRDVAVTQLDQMARDLICRLRVIHADRVLPGHAAAAVEHHERYAHAVELRVNTRLLIAEYQHAVHLAVSDGGRQLDHAVLAGDVRHHERVALFAAGDHRIHAHLRVERLILQIRVRAEQRRDIARAPVQNVPVRAVRAVMILPRDAENALARLLADAVLAVDRNGHRRR